MAWITTLVAAAGALLTAWLMVLVLIHAGRAGYDLPPAAIVAGMGGGMASLAGWGLVAWRRDGLVLAGVGATFLLIGGFLSILSIGVLVLPFAILAMVAVVTKAHQRVEPVPVAVVAAAALLVGLGLPLAAMAATDGPAVSCLDGGVGSSSSIFRPSDSGSGSSTMGSSSAADDGAVTGTVRNGGREYRYRCEGERLVDFEVTDE